MREQNCLPDGTPIPHTAYFASGAVHDWTGADCPNCRGTGEDFRRDDGGVVCRDCGGTGDEYGPTWLWEE